LPSQGVGVGHARLATALASRHLARGLPSLGRWGQTCAPGCSLKASGCAAPQA